MLVAARRGCGARLTAEPAGLYEACWRPEVDAGRAELVPYDGTFVDCGTPADYLAANLHQSGGATVVGAGAVVAGTAERCVVWPGLSCRSGRAPGRGDPGGTAHGRAAAQTH